jgi:hypothetical protein
VHGRHRASARGAGARVERRLRGRASGWWRCRSVGARKPAAWSRRAGGAAGAAQTRWMRAAPGPGEPKAPARPSLAVAAMLVRGRNGSGASAGAVRRCASRRRAAATCVAWAKDARGIGIHG